MQDNLYHKQEKVYIMKTLFFNIAFRMSITVRAIQPQN